MYYLNKPLLPLFIFSIVSSTVLQYTRICTPATVVNVTVYRVGRYGQVDTDITNKTTPELQLRSLLEAVVGLQSRGSGAWAERELSMGFVVGWVWDGQGLSMALVVGWAWAECGLDMG